MHTNWVKAFCLVVCSLTGSTISQAYETVAVISGIAQVADGDGILFGKVEVRLQGIAAPEDRRKNPEEGGQASSDNLRGLIEGKLLICHLDGSTAGKSKRPVGVCYLGGKDIGEYQVETGHARDCPRFSGGRYAQAELKAQDSGNDLSAIYELKGYCLSR